MRSELMLNYRTPHYYIPLVKTAALATHHYKQPIYFNRYTGACTGRYSEYCERILVQTALVQSQELVDDQLIISQL